MRIAGAVWGDLHGRGEVHLQHDVVRVVAVVPHRRAHVVGQHERRRVLRPRVQYARLRLAQRHRVVAVLAAASIMPTC